MKLKKIQKKFSLVLIFIILALLGAIVYFKPEVFNGLLLNQSQSSKTFESKYLNFGITLQNGFRATDENSRTTIVSDSGLIYITRNGTQFNDLDSYIDNFDQHTSLKLESEYRYLVGDKEVISRVFEKTDVSGGSEKIVYLYFDNIVYKISTTSEDLYDELDQIAKSFKYTGK